MPVSAVSAKTSILSSMHCGTPTVAKYFPKKMIGSRMARPARNEVLETARSGDTLVVTELSRMTRSFLNLLDITKLLAQRRINLGSLR